MRVRAPQGAGVDIVLGARCANGRPTNAGQAREAGQTTSPAHPRRHSFLRRPASILALTGFISLPARAPSVPQPFALGIEELPQPLREFPAQARSVVPVIDIGGGLPQETGQGLRVPLPALAQPHRVLSQVAADPGHSGLVEQHEARPGGPASAQVSHESPSGMGPAP